MTSTSRAQGDAVAAMEKEANDLLCAAAQAIIERDYRPRPGQASAFAPDGSLYHHLKTRFYTTAGEAVRELEGQLRNLNVASGGDTVWWRVKPAVEFEIQNKKWQARCRLALGWARDEKPEHMPGGGEEKIPAAYPNDGIGAAPGPGLGGQLPTWKCHKVVQADRITGFDASDPPKFLMLECGVEVQIQGELKLRLPADRSQWAQGYLVRYRDGFESWSPRAEFEDGYTRMSL